MINLIFSGTSLPVSSTQARRIFVKLLNYLYFYPFMQNAGALNVVFEFEN